MMIKKVEIFWWGSNVEKNMDFFFFAVQATFLPVNTHEHYQSCSTGTFGCLTTSPPIFKWKYWQENFILEKNQNIH